MSIMSLGACLFAGGAGAATGRADYANVRTTTAGATTAMSSRMPSMPTLPLVSVGNLSTTIPTAGGNADAGDNNGGDNKSCCEGVEHAKFCELNKSDVCEILLCDDGWVPNAGKTACEEVSVSECDDKGVKNSEYTVDRCMNDILTCVNSGVLPNGLNDLFNEDMFDSVVSGMGLCAAQVDRCLTEVRRNCVNVYATRADVWMDFNSRKIQPEYYSFVLYNTGLTPSQAKKTCLLLDTNTYGKSFAAVNGTDVVTGEYNHQAINTYNDASGAEKKNNPMGSRLDTDGIDAQRGYYARWDASAGQCLVRVAAYNRDKLITNEWLFGVVGDKSAAEVWKYAGETFTCDKDLFGFSLMKRTQDVAVLGVGGGTVVGTVVGAVANLDRKKAMEACEKATYRDELLVKIKKSKKAMKLDDYLRDTSFDTKVVSGAEDKAGKTQRTYSYKTIDKITRDQCLEIVRLVELHKMYKDAVDECTGADEQTVVNRKLFRLDCSNTHPSASEAESINALASNPDAQKDAILKMCIESQIESLYGTSQFKALVEKYKNSYKEDSAKAYAVEMIKTCLDEEGTTAVYKFRDPTDKNCTVAFEILELLGHPMYYLGSCSFHPINLAKFDVNKGITCTANPEGCQLADEIAPDVAELGELLKDIGIDTEDAQTYRQRVGKATAIGAAIGAGAGGLATAITALVESENINCRVGDNLGRVGFNKSYTIDRLKDLYVKWKLNLTDAQQKAAGSTAITDKEGWEDACGAVSEEEKCKEVQFYFKAKDAKTTEWMYAPCTWKDVNGAKKCTASEVLLKSYGLVKSRPTWATSTPLSGIPGDVQRLSVAKLAASNNSQ
jgi:hypothetical protein